MPANGASVHDVISSLVSALLDQAFRSPLLWMLMALMASSWWITKPARDGLQRTVVRLRHRTNKDAFRN